jgi:sugar O-acyltransferase (sialic acid O-acetyltransferase NeuD family)
MARIFGLIGAGGFAREVMPSLRQQAGKDAEIYFVETAPSQREVNGMKVLSEAEFLALPGEKFYSIAIGDGHTRQKIAAGMQGKATAFSVIDSKTHQGDAITLGNGAILTPFTTLTGNIAIGAHFHANIYSYVGHDCVIGDYVTFAPSVHCNGNVHIGNHVYVGTGAIIRQGTAEQPITIGDGAVIGMGAVVTKSVPPGVTVIGNPARVMEKK